MAYFSSTLRSPAFSLQSWPPYFSEVLRHSILFRRRESSAYKLQLLSEYRWLKMSYEETFKPYVRSTDF